MRLSNVILDLGRVVAYYPNLKKVTGSTTATVLLCQFLYWWGKKKTHWVYKTSEEIEEETGLTYNEQVTAREKLVKAGILIEQYKRLDHTLEFRLDVDTLNDLWEEITGKESSPIEKEESPEEYFNKLEREKETLPKPDMQKYENKDRDYIKDLVSSPGAKKATKIEEMRDMLEKKLHIIANNKKWTEFIQFAYKREVSDGEPLEVFIKWAIAEGFNPVYWTPEKMVTLYPQAFIKPEPIELSKDFTPKLPEIKQEEYAPMPRGLGKRKIE